MSDFLTSILDNTVSALANGNGAAHQGADNGPKILSENHDTSTINWLAGMSDPGEMIRCQYLPQLRREANETDAAYFARVGPMIEALPADERDTIKRAGMKAAIERGQWDTSTGKVALMVAGNKPAWSGLGVQIETATSAAHARRLSSTDFPVMRKPYCYMDENGVMHESTRSFVLYRGDTGAELGAVGSKTKVIQNSDGTDFLDEIIGEFGARYHTAGALHGGAKVWFQIELVGQSFEVVKGDVQQCFGTFINPHDGSGCALVFPTVNRIECDNTMRRAIAEADLARMMRIRHTGNLKSKIQDARNALGVSVKSFDEYKEQCAVLVRTPVNAQQASNYFANVLDAMVELTQSTVKVTARQVQIGASALANQDILDGIISGTEERQRAEKQYDKAIRDRSTLLEDIVERWNSPTCARIQDTAFGVVNAATENADHYDRRTRGTDAERASNRFESIIDGPRDQMKQIAFRQALALAN